MKYKYLIIGAGISGLSLARLLQLRGESRFLLLEKEGIPGGLCRTKIINNHVLDIGGGHLFLAKNNEVFDFVFSHIPKTAFNYYERLTKVEIEGGLIDYPVEASLWQIPVDKRSEYLLSLEEAGELNNKKEPTDFSQWVYWKLGKKIAENYMIPYNKKIWGIDPKEMDIDWLHKIPRFNPDKIRQSFKTKALGHSEIPSHKTFYYPIEGGFQRISDAISKHINKNIICDCPVFSLKRANGAWVVNNEFEADMIINTAPWPALRQALDIPQNLWPALEKLRSNSIVISLIENPYDHHNHWHYIPDMSIRHHRELFIHNFSPNSGKGGLFVETNSARWKRGEPVSRFCVKPIFEFVNDFSYPIPVIGHANAIKTILDYYQKDNLFGLGRWGQWSYLNVDDCIYEAIKLAKRI